MNCVHVCNVSLPSLALNAKLQEYIISLIERRTLSLLKMAESDWDTVTYLRKKAPAAREAKSSRAVNAAMRQGGQVETSKKFSAGQNRQKNTDQNTAKLDRETEELHHKHVTLDVGKAIMQGRQLKNLTQKELATKINEKQQVINEYELGRAIPNQQILIKMERVIGIKLRGKDIGTPLGSKKK